MHLPALHSRTSRQEPDVERGHSSPHCFASPLQCFYTDSIGAAGRSKQRTCARVRVRGGVDRVQHYEDEGEAREKRGRSDGEARLFVAAILLYLFPPSLLTLLQFSERWSTAFSTPR